MSFIRLLEDIIIIYIIYKVIFSFIIPVYNTTKQVKSKVSEMQQRMSQQQQMYQQQQYAQQQQQRQYEENRAAKAKAVEEDYIDYEEVK